MKDLLLTLIQLLLFAIFARIIISWLLVAGMRNEFILRVDRTLGMITDPLMRPLRRFIPPIGMIDITPMVAIIVLWILQRVIRSAL